MKKKTIVSAILASSLTLAATLGGCSLVTKNVNADLKQEIAEINITKTEAFDKEFEKTFENYGAQYSQYKELLGTTKILKRELLSYFVTTGYSLYQQNGSYKTTFEQLVTQLVNTAAVTQYAATYLLQYKMAHTDGKTAEQVLAEFLAYDSDLGRYEYLLGGKDSIDVKVAEYNLRYSINAALDTYETTILKIESSSAGSDTRTAPTGVDTEQEDYFPAMKNPNGDGYLDKLGNVTDKLEEAAIDYNIYTGYKLDDNNDYSLAKSGEYQNSRSKDLAEKSTRATRIRAYNRFVSGFVGYGLIDARTEDIKDVRNLQYVQSQYLSQLKSRVINKYYELFEEEQVEKLKGDNYAYIEARYQDALSEQVTANSTEDAFATAMGNISDTSFTLYVPEAENGGKFGFVYNILLPFSSAQSLGLSAVKKETDANKNPYIDNDIDSGYTAMYYEYRNTLLNNITSTDQRKPWFDGATEYAFKAPEGFNYYNGGNDERDWLFFENNLTKTDRYENLDKYDGRYSYNGWVEKTESGKYSVHPYAIDIDGMLKEFSAYIDYVLGTSNNVTYLPDENGVTYNGTKNDAYYAYSGDAFYKNGGAKNDSGKVELDYSKLLYAYGQVNVTEDGNTSPEQLRANTLNKDTKQYKVMSAVNELQYAYTTDTGVLSQYIGYTVNAGDTNYIKEFEYACHKAVNNGTGSFAVCAGDYGWHLIYVTYAYDLAQVEGGEYDGEVYKPDWTKIDTKGTFENLFYEWIKSNDVSETSTTISNKLVTMFVTDDTVTKHESRYSDYLNWDNK
ncbi:MAG: hypothetical protein K2L67_06540 [Clostridia bacterium]|nr:hypothetical protein [Clostridia bacterium]